MPNFSRLAKRLEVKTSTSFAAGMASGAGRIERIPLSGRPWNAINGDPASNSLVSICLSWVRKHVGSGRMVVGSEAGGDYDPIEGHPMTALIRRPSPYRGFREMLGGLGDSLLLDGNGYVVKFRDQLGEVIALRWEANYRVQIDVEWNQVAADEGGPIRGYVIQSQLGAIQRYWMPTDVIHFRSGIDPINPWMGLSEFKRQSRNVGSIAAAERYTAAILMNAHAGKIIAPKDGQPMAEDQLGKVAAKVRKGLKAELAGDLIESNLPVELMDIGLGPREMSLADTPNRAESYILAQLGLNALTLNLPSASQLTYANKAEARREAFENCIQPLQDLIAETFETQLLPDFDYGGADSVWWDRSDVAALREDTDARADRAVSLYTGGVAERDEARAMVDLPPLAPPTAEAAAEAVADATAEAEAEAEPIGGPETETDSAHPEQPTIADHL